MIRLLSHDDLDTDIFPRRIGPAPGLSVLSGPGPSGDAIPQQTRPDQSRSPQMSSSLQLNGSATNDTHGYGRQNNTPLNSRVDDPYGASSNRRPTHQLNNSQGSGSTKPDEFGNWKSTGRPGVGTGKRPPSAGSAHQTQRFTITNALPLEIPEESKSSQHQRKGSTSNKGPWLTANEEKQILYQQAMERVQVVQGGPIQKAPVRIVHAGKASEC